MFRATCLAIFTSLTIAADCGLDSNQLLANANTALNPAPILWRAVESGSQQGRVQLHDYAKNTKSEYWLEKLIGAGYTPAALSLSRLSDEPRIAKRLMHLAAKGGVAEAQYEYALSREDFTHRETWLKAAAEQHYYSAQTALADWYLLHHMPQKAEKWLALTAKNDSQSAFQLGFIRWQQGERDTAFSLFSQAADSGHTDAQNVIAVLKRYQPVNVNELLTPVETNWTTPSCKQSIQPFATGLAEIVQLHEIIQAFSNDRRFTDLPLCVKNPIWLAEGSLHCDENWQGKGRLGCDLAPLAGVAKSKKFTHSVILARSGKANVNNGVMYLDVGDTYSVFAHELAHFVGFVDEYPLTTGLAKEYCARKSAPNLVFNGSITYAPQENIEIWESFEYPISLYPARTCNNVGEQSYKPSRRTTFMENHDAKYIPPLYLNIWRRQLLEPSAQRPIAMNFFQLFQALGDTQRAGEWLSVYRQLRSGNATDSQHP